MNNNMSEISNFNNLISNGNYIVNDSNGNLNSSNYNTNSFKYTITIIGEDRIRNICLNDFGKSIVTFGRSKDNDIVLSSLLVSSHHGYFNFSNGLISIFDSQSKNGFYINNLKGNNGTILKDGDSIKIDNPVEPLDKGIIMIITMGSNDNRWLEFNLQDKELVTIGRGDDCDIVLNRIAISLKHAKIIKIKEGYILSSYDNKSGVILNNNILTGQAILKDKDVIIINNIKLIYNKKQILYQAYDYGVRIDAIDVVKTVKLKGKKKEISQHIDFTANPGELIAFVGGSGAGKSTFMKCISGVSKPTSGQVLINGNELFSNYDVLKNLIGYVPQENIIFADLTLIDMLKYAANLRMPDDATTTEKNDRIKDVLNIVELADKKDVMIRNLSGGQQKRACIAVELIADPKLFFLDEPTSGLDPGTERSIMKTLRKMSDSGKTIILVTHNTLNLHLCDKVVFFGYGGKLCFDGKPSDALSFFKVNDFVDIYNLLDNNTDEWSENFSKSNYKKVPEVNKTESTSTTTKKSKSFTNQFITLIRRKLKTLFNNRQQLLMLFGQAPLIGLLLPIVVTDNLFYSYEETKAILFSISTAAIWIGLLNAIQEICRERVILEKEFMADLRISAYLASKVVYLLLLALVQSILLVTAFMLVVDVPKIGLMSNWYVESITIVFLTIISASAMGLVASSIAKDSSVALTMPTLLLIPQLLFSGMLFPLNGIVDKISNFILCRWSMEALGTINDLNSLISAVQEAIPGYIREVENYYTFTANHLAYDLSIIILMTIILIGASYYILKHQLESGR